MSRCERQAQQPSQRDPSSDLPSPLSHAAWLCCASSRTLQYRSPVIMATFAKLTTLLHAHAQHRAQSTAQESALRLIGCQQRSAVNVQNVLAAEAL